MEKDMAKVCLDIQMEEFIADYSRMIRRVGREKSTTKTNCIMRESSKMI